MYPWGELQEVPPTDFGGALGASLVSVVSSDGLVFFLSPKPPTFLEFGLDLFEVKVYLSA